MVLDHTVGGQPDEAEVEPSSATVPLRALVSLPVPLDERGLFNAVKSDLGGERAQELAGRYVSDQYLSKKLVGP